jgi:predicted neutral ceramidase superfamily lipid hydrolase
MASIVSSMVIFPLYAWFQAKFVHDIVRVRWLKWLLLYWTLSLGTGFSSQILFDISAIEPLFIQMFSIIVWSVVGFTLGSFIANSSRASK